MTNSRNEGFLYLALFILCIPSANWMIGNVGTYCVPDGPCMIPVTPNLNAPSGVLMIGLALVLRDLVQRRLGKLWALVAIVAGAALSGLVASSALVMASVGAFLFSELADFAVYTPLQRNRFITAVIASSAVGLVVDSMLFLFLAFGSLDYVWGQIIGKAWMVICAVPIIWKLRQRDQLHGVLPV